MKIILFAACVAIVAPLAANAQGYSGFRALGEMLGGRKARDEAVYQEAYGKQMELQTAKYEAEAAYYRRLNQEADMRTRADLGKIWVQFGLSESEAASVASTYVFEESQPAINERAAREGWEPTVAAAVRAYKEYQYPLANQLLVAGMLAFAASKDQTAGPAP